MASLGIHIPAEITDYREKIIGGLTLRQLASLGVALLTGGLTFLLCFRFLGQSAQQCSHAIMAAAALPAAVGFIRPQQMDFEKYLLMRYAHWLRAVKIPYKTTTRGDNTYGPVRKKKRKRDEFTVIYYRYARRRERRILRATRKNIRKTRKEIRKAQKAFRRAQRKARRAQKH